VAAQIAAPIERVWSALVVPDEVTAWDGVTPIRVPDDYPRPGQHALWSTHMLGVRWRLHDRIVAVDPPERFASDITVGFVSLHEEYRLRVLPAGGCEVVSNNLVRSRLPLPGRLADGLTRRNVEGSLARLRLHCESDPST